MKFKHIVMAVTSALLTFGLIPVGSAQSVFGSALDIKAISIAGTRPVPEGIEVITVVGMRPAPEGIEVITVVGKRPAPTVASACVNQVMAGRATESRRASRNSARQAIKDCIDQAQT